MSQKGKLSDCCRRICSQEAHTRPCVKQALEMAGIMEFECSEKRGRPRTIREKGLQLSRQGPEKCRSLVSTNWEDLCEDTTTLGLVRPATAGNTGRRRQGGGCRERGDGKGGLLACWETGTTDDVRARLTSESGGCQGGCRHCNGASRSPMKR